MICRVKQISGSSSIMEDADGISRKQDRKNGLLGWWVAYVLILPFSTGTLTAAAELHSLGKGESSSLPYFKENANALSAPITPSRRAVMVDRVALAKSNPELVQSAEGMEAMFLDSMMKVMRQTIPKNEMDLESPATQIYRSMMDAEYAAKAAHHGGVGLADQIIAYLQTQGYNLSKSPGGQTGQTGRQTRETKEKP